MRKLLVLGAGTAGTMGGINNNIVCKRGYFLLKTLIHQACKVIYGKFICFLGKVGSAYITNK